jgi:aryl-alcohol dehydrogenase-like predicted oxidoreductase
MKLSDLRTLGRSGLAVSPLALGTMTFNNKHWGCQEDVGRDIFNAYVDEGGNFIDTADVYSAGASEQLVGKLISERNLRNEVVLATKFSFSGGNCRKNAHRALEQSLKRLNTDYVDLYWMHVWDRVTPVEETLQTLSNLVGSGKIRYFGLSNIPAWYACRAATLAQVHNIAGPIALQLAYSLAERTIEREHVPLARELGLGIIPWSPLAFGFLTGKYNRSADGSAKTGTAARLDAEPMFQMFRERHWKLLDQLREVSERIGKSMSQVALAWVIAQHGVSTTLVGARTIAQLRSNLESLSVILPVDQAQHLDQASALDIANPYSMFSDAIHRGIFGGASIQGWQ